MMRRRNRGQVRIESFLGVLICGALPYQSIQGRELSFKHTVGASILQARQQIKGPGDSIEESATIQNARWLSAWNGPWSIAQTEGNFELNTSRGEGVRSTQINLRESISVNRGRTYFSLSLEGQSRISDGDLNLDLSEQVDRDRNIGILENLNPNSAVSSGNRLYEEQLNGTIDFSYRLSRRLQFGLGTSRQYQNLRNDFSSSELEQNNNFENYNANFEYRFFSRSFLSGQVNRSIFITSGKSNTPSATALQNPNDPNFRIRQIENNWTLGMGYQFSRALTLSLTYFESESKTQSLDTTNVKGPGAQINWQPTSLDSLSLQISRYTLGVGDEDDDIIAEFGQLQYRRQLAGDSEFILTIEKSYDSVRANFEAFSDNQVLLDTRRNEIYQGSMQFQQRWQKLSLTFGWTYLEYRTPQLIPSFFENQLNSEIALETGIDQQLVWGVEGRRSGNRSPGTEEDLDLIGAFLNIQRRYPIQGAYVLQGLIEAGLRYDWSEEDRSETQVQRVAATISAGLQF